MPGVLAGTVKLLTESSESQLENTVTVVKNIWFTKNTFRIRGLNRVYSVHYLKSLTFQINMVGRR